MSPDDALKQAAARSAVALIRDGMIVGLGTGSTAAFAIDELGDRVKHGLRITGVPTSERTAAQARALGIALIDLSDANLSDAPPIDLTIDGADQIEGHTLNLIKGLGGALLREKLVATASRKLVIIAHASKLVPRLTGPLPVEIVPFAFQTTARRLSTLGLQPALRRNPDGSPFRTDGGNYILDCAFESGSAAQLSLDLDHVTGVVEHGFFVGMTSEVHLAAEDGVRILQVESGV